MQRHTACNYAHELSVSGVLVLAWQYDTRHFPGAASCKLHFSCMHTHANASYPHFPVLHPVRRMHAASCNWC